MNPRDLERGTAHQLHQVKDGSTQWWVVAILALLLGLLPALLVVLA